MLKVIKIKNFLTIKEMQLDLSDKITAIIGESGAGKSLILQAIENIFSYKSSRSIIGNFDEKCTIKLIFELNEYQKTYFENIGFVDSEAVIEKIIYKDKTKTYINHEPVNIKTISSLKKILVGIVSQDYKFDIFDSDNLLNIFDEMIDQKIIRDYTDTYNIHKSLELKKSALVKDMEEISSKHPEILLDEINKVNPKKDEYEQLKAKLDSIKLSHIIKNESFYMLHNLYEDENSIEDRLNKIIEKVAKIEGISEDAKYIKERLESAYIAISDVKKSIYSLTELSSESQEDIDTVESRMFQIEELQRRFSKPLNEIVEEKITLEHNIDKLKLLSIDIEKVNKELNVSFDNLEKKAEILSNARKRISGKILMNVKTRLSQLMLDNSVTEFKFDKHKLDELGKDRVSILFSANPDLPLTEIGKTASGGERSRFMLALIYSLCEIKKAYWTLIADEVESGTSSKTLASIIKTIKDMSLSNQIILITHQPKVAEMAEKIIKIEKYFDGRQTTSSAVYVNKKDVNKIYA